MVRGSRRKYQSLPLDDLSNQAVYSAHSDQKDDQRNQVSQVRPGEQLTSRQKKDETKLRRMDKPTVTSEYYYCG